MGSSNTIALATTDTRLVEQIRDALQSNVESTLTLLALDTPGGETADAKILLVDNHLDAVDLLAYCEQFRADKARNVGIIGIVESEDPRLERMFEAAVDDILIHPFNHFSILARIKSQLRRIETAEQLDFKIRDSWALIEITSTLLGSNDLLDNLFEMALTLASELNAARASVVLVPPENDMGLVVASSDNSQIQDLVINLKNYPEIVEVCTHAEPLVIQDVNDSQMMTDILPTIQSMQVKSVALFPIVEEEDVLGVIFLRFGDKRIAFSEREKVFCQTVANATSIALRSHEFVETLREKEAKIAEVENQAKSQLAALQPYENFFNASVDGMIVLSDTGVIVFVNPEGAALLGKPPGQIRGLPIYDILPGKAHEILDFLIEQSERGNRVFRDMALSQANNITKIVSATVGLLGAEGMILFTLRDVTQERKTASRLNEAQQQLIASEKQNAIMEVAGTAAHELNQPLTSILTSIAMFKKLLGGDNPPIVEKLFSDMESEADRMTEIIKKLSSLTSYSTKDYVGDSKIVDLESASTNKPQSS